jgi:hypothetical protein
MGVKKPANEWLLAHLLTLGFRGAKILGGYGLRPSEFMG